MTGGGFSLRLIEVVHDRVGERLATFSGERGNDKGFTFPAQLAHESAHRFLARFGGQQVGLVEHEPARLAIELDVVFLELRDDRLRVFHRVGAVVERRDVDEVQQQPRAREVAQELVAQARAFGRAFDEPRECRR